MLPRIRLAINEDISSIMAIVKALVILMNAEGNYQWHSTYPLESDFQKDIDAGVLYVSVLEEENEKEEIVGCIAITTSQPVEYSDLSWGNDIVTAVVPHRLAVSASVQGKGIAQYMMSFVEKWARERGILCIRVDTNILNVRMQHIFEKMTYNYIGNIFFVKCIGKSMGI